MNQENPTNELLNQCISKSLPRMEFWAEFVRGAQVQKMLEVGVYQGDFAAFILDRCKSVNRYYMIDPWRHLNDWNKPANQDNASFERLFQEARAKTDFAMNRRVILRGKTTEVINQISDNELDFAYIDGDHTLKGVTIDLIRVYPKVRVGGFIGGDDFCRTVWQHNTKFEPTLVFPFAVYFAEAVGATIYAIPNTQFCLHKTEDLQFTFVDLTGQYNDLSLRQQFIATRLLKLAVAEEIPMLAQVASRIRTLLR